MNVDKDLIGKSIRVSAIPGLAWADYHGFPYITKVVGVYGFDNKNRILIDITDLSKSVPIAGWHLSQLDSVEREKWDIDSAFDQTRPVQYINLGNFSVIKSDTQQIHNHNSVCFELQVLRLLRITKELIRDPERWTIKVPARDDHHLYCEPCSSAAQCYCLLGALERANYMLFNVAELPLLSQVNSPFVKLAIFNDTHTHAQVLALLDLAIKKAEYNYSLVKQISPD